MRLIHYIGETSPFCMFLCHTHLSHSTFDEIMRDESRECDGAHSTIGHRTICENIKSKTTQHIVFYVPQPPAARLTWVRFMIIIIWTIIAQNVSVNEWNMGHEWEIWMDFYVFFSSFSIEFCLRSSMGDDGLFNWHIWALASVVNWSHTREEALNYEMRMKRFVVLHLLQNDFEN